MSLARICGAAAFLSLASIAPAQDFNVSCGFSLLMPSNSYGAAGGPSQAGTWNPADGGQPPLVTPLQDLSGTATGASVAITTFNGFFFDNPLTTGDDELLMDDVFDAPSSLLFEGLAQGNYEVLTYAWAPDDPSFLTQVEVTGSPDGIRVCGGMWPGQHEEGITYTSHTITVDGTQPNIEVLFSVASGFSSCNGAQLIYLGAPVGSPFCSAQPNSTGAPATIAAVGSTQVMENDLTLTTSDLPVGENGYFLGSLTQGFVPMPGGSSGDLCLGGAIGRFTGPGQVFAASAAGTASLTIDLTALPVPTGTVQAMAGETWNFQSWYRDTTPAGPTSNFSNGVSVTLQ